MCPETARQVRTIPRQLFMLTQESDPVCSTCKLLSLSKFYQRDLTPLIPLSP